MSPRLAGSTGTHLDLVRCHFGWHVFARCWRVHQWPFKSEQRLRFPRDTKQRPGRSKAWDQHRGSQARPMSTCWTSDPHTFQTFSACDAKQTRSDRSEGIVLNAVRAPQLAHAAYVAVGNLATGGVMLLFLSFLQGAGEVGNWYTLMVNYRGDQPSPLADHGWWWLYTKSGQYWLTILKVCQVQNEADGRSRLRSYLNWPWTVDDFPVTIK